MISTLKFVIKCFRSLALYKMRILIDIFHPADVHFFHNAITELQKRKHTIVVTTRQTEIVTGLLNHFGIPYTIIECKTKNRLLSPFRLFARDFLLWRFCKKYKPDLLTGVNSVYSAHVGKFIRKPSVIWDHTDHYRLLHKLTRPFATVVYSPDCYYAKPSKKQVFYPGFHEIAYLHPNRFKPDPSIVKSLGINPNEKYCIIRLSAWKAFHDIGQHGLNRNKLTNFIKTISQHAKTYLSSESSIVPELKQYELKIPAHLIHHVIAFASLYVGEGASMASESATLGVPSVYINTLKLGYINMHEKYKLLKQTTDTNEAAKFCIQWLKDPLSRQKCQEARKKLLSEKFDVTNFMVDIIEKYSFNK